LLPESTIGPANNPNENQNDPSEPITGTFTWKHADTQFIATALQLKSKSWSISLVLGPENDYASTVADPHTYFGTIVSLNGTSSLCMVSNQEGSFEGASDCPSYLNLPDIEIWPYPGGGYSLARLNIKAVRIAPPLLDSEIPPSDLEILLSSLYVNIASSCYWQGIFWIFLFFDTQLLISMTLRYNILAVVVYSTTLLIGIFLLLAFICHSIVSSHARVPLSRNFPVATYQLLPESWIIPVNNLHQKGPSEPITGTFTWRHADTQFIATALQLYSKSCSINLDLENDDYASTVADPHTDFGEIVSLNGVPDLKMVSEGEGSFEGASDCPSYLSFPEIAIRPYPGGPFPGNFSRAWLYIKAVRIVPPLLYSEIPPTDLEILLSSLYVNIAASYYWRGILLLLLFCCLFVHFWRIRRT
jgi:hypothetical protein